MSSIPEKIDKYIVLGELGRGARRTEKRLIVGRKQITSTARERQLRPNDGEIDSLALG